MRATYTSALLALAATVSAQGYYESPALDGTTLTAIRGIDGATAVQTTAASLAACETSCTNNAIDIGDGVTKRKTCTAVIAPMLKHRQSSLQLASSQSTHPAQAPA